MLGNYIVAAAAVVLAAGAYFVSEDRKQLLAQRTIALRSATSARPYLLAGSLFSRPSKILIETSKFPSPKHLMASRKGITAVFLSDDECNICQKEISNTVQLTRYLRNVGEVSIDLYSFGAGQLFDMVEKENEDKRLNMQRYSIKDRTRWVFETGLGSTPAALLLDADSRVIFTFAGSFQESDSINWKKTLTEHLENRN